MRYLKYLVSSVVFLGVIGALLAVKASQIGLIMNYAQAAKQEGPPPETVSTAVAAKSTWQETLSAVGSVEAGKGVTLSTDVAGIVTRVAFESGDAVRLGQALVELDTSVERAQLASARARLELARTTLARTERLASANVVTTAEFDSAAATARSMQAEAAALEAQIARKVVTAPFAGKLGIRLVNVGQFVSPGTALCTLQSQRGEFVDFPREKMTETCGAWPHGYVKMEINPRDFVDVFNTNHAHVVPGDHLETLAIWGELMDIPVDTVD